MRISSVLSRKGQGAALLALLLLWLYVAARILMQETASPRMLGISLFAFIIGAPFIAWQIRRVPVYLFAVYAAAVPFTDLLTTATGATLSKLLAIGAGAVLVFAMLLARRAVAPSRALIAIAVLTVYVGATIFWSIDPVNSLSSYGFYWDYILLFAAIALYPVTLADAKIIFAGALAGALAAAAYGDVLFIQGHQLAQSRLVMGDIEHSIDSNAFAAALLMPTALTVTMFLAARVWFTKAMWFAASAVMFYGFIACGSRGGTIALAAMLLYLLFALPYKRQILALIAAGGAFAMATPVGQRWMQPDVATADGRTEIWRIAFASLHEYWLGGAGIGNFRLAFQQYYLSVPHMWLPWDRASHSVFLQSAVEYGIIGFILVMAVWYFMFFELGGLAVSRSISDVCTALRCGVLGLLVAGISLDLMMFKYTWLAFSLVAVMRSALVTAGLWKKRPGKRKPARRLPTLMPDPQRAF